MRFAALLLLATTSVAAIAASPATTPDPRLKGSYKFNEGGWTYVHLQGTPDEIGFQHGYLLAREIEDNVHVYTVTAPREDKRPWSFFREAGKTILWPHLDAEYQAELKGIAEGLKAQGSKLDLWDIVALNGDHRTEQLLSSDAECEGAQAESAGGGGAGQVQRLCCDGVGDQGREDRDCAQQLVFVCGGRALDRGV